jgi:hypothetical protein
MKKLLNVVALLLLGAVVPSCYGASSSRFVVDDGRFLGRRVVVADGVSRAVDSLARDSDGTTRGASVSCYGPPGAPLWLGTSKTGDQCFVPSSVSELRTECFSGSRGLTFVVFEQNSKVRTIGKGAFRESGVRAIRIPASVEVLGEWCFSDCKSLTSVTFDSSSKLQRI